MSTPTVLPPAALARAGPAPRAGTLVRAGLARGALYLTPVPLAAAVSEPLGRTPWPVPVGALVVGWCAAAALAVLARDRDATGAARLVLAGFGAVVAGWSVLLALAPEWLAGDRGLAYAVSLPALALLAVVAVALATGAETVLLRWSVPAVLVAVAAIAGWLPAGLVAPALLVAIALLVGRGFAGAWRRSRHRRSGGGGGWRGGSGAVAASPRPGAVAVSHRPGAIAALAVAASQAVAVVAVWRVGAAAAPAGGAPAVAPLLVAVPMIEVWVGWHLARVAAGLAGYDDPERHQRYVRRLGWATLVVLLPPLAAGAALAGTAHRLPYGLSAHPDAPALVLAMSAGVLLVAVFGLGRLLAARDRPGLAAMVTAGPVLGGFVLHAGVPGLAAGSLSGWGSLLSAVVIALMVAVTVGLVLAANVLFDTRSPR